MFAWLVVRSDHADLLYTAMTAVWGGGEAVLCQLGVPVKEEVRRLVLAWPEGARARRAARWPDLLADWHDIYDDALFPGDAVPVLGEQVSGLGADALAVHAAPGLAGASIAWYARGALARYEHVGSATVAWTPEEGLGRPLDGSLRSAFALGGRRLANALGAARDANVLDRMLKTNQAVGQTLVERAMCVMLDADPPPPDELAGMVARSPQRRIRLP